jgi:hypothetical protein
MASKSASGTWRRWLRWTIRIALVFGILICIAAALIWFYLERTAAEGRKKLAAAIAETDALDPRWRWEEIQEDLPPIPDAENSMRLIHQATDLLKGWNASSLLLESGNGLLDDMEEWPANRQLDEERLSLIRNALKEREDALALAKSLKDYPRGQTVIRLSPLLLDTSLKHAVDCRVLISLLELDIERMLHEGRPKEAVSDIHAILHSGAGLRQDPFFVSQIARISARSHAVLRIERLLGTGENHADDLESLMAHVRAELGEDLMVVAIRGERAGWHLHMENLESGHVSLADFCSLGLDDKRIELDFLQRFGFFLYQNFLYEDHAFMLQQYNRTLEIAQLPDTEQTEAWAEWSEEFKATTGDAFARKRLILSRLMFPAVQKCGQIFLRNKANLSSALTALAAERFRLANKRWPKDLQELCPTYLKTVPINPADGKAFKYVRRSDGVLISWIDIGGFEEDDETPRHSLDDDHPNGLGLRLWNPDHRRLPPELKKEGKPKEDDDS